MWPWKSHFQKTLLLVRMLIARGSNTNIPQLGQNMENMQEWIKSQVKNVLLNIV